VALADAFADVDLCLRLGRMGRRTLFTPFAQVRRLDPEAGAPAWDPASMARFPEAARVLRARWAEVLANDPHYNPNLALESPPFALAAAPRLARPGSAGGHSGEGA